ncbi:MAG: LysM peptidoglycan-binding domain-containing protein [Thermodesulfovibrionales bacterium]|nr:LysM peptidoglycan-binding domain-containing protein [Thermodesulfovibrionales bacterium]
MTKEFSTGKIPLSFAVFILAFFFAVQCFADFSYTIKKGDNPQTLAKKFDVRVKDIIKINKLKPRKLMPGMKITIPSSEQKAHRKSKKAMNRAENKRETKRDRDHADSESLPDMHDENTSVYHMVDKGDTLSAIARKYSVPVSELRGLNDLDSSKLRIGQRLLLKHTKPQAYTVRKGDSLYKIARQFDVGLDELREINDLDSDSLKPGQKIVLEHEPEPRTPKQYDTILSQGVHIQQELQNEPEPQEQGLHDRLIVFAKKLLNIPYRFGGNSMFGIDCSAYVQKVYSLIGINIPRSARQQFTEGDPVDKSELSIGDLVFFKTYASFPSHVGIYLGNNLFIHASSRSKKVTIDSLDTPYYIKRYIGAKRLIQEMKDGEQTFEQDG